MDLEILHRHPLIRILIPLLGGILFAEFTDISVDLKLLVFILIVLFSFLFSLDRKSLPYRYRWVLGALISLSFFTIGFLRMQEVARPMEATEETTLYKGIVESRDIETEEFIRYALSIDGDTDKLVYLYHYKDSVHSTYKVGEVLSFQGRLNQPDSPLFEEDFNYAQFLKHKHIKGLFYLKHDAVSLLGDASTSWPYWLYKYRDKLSDRYQQLGLEGDELALVSALTLGVKDEFTEDVKISYSEAGVSHVLALSGLHIGLLFVLLVSTFQFVFRRIRIKQILSLIFTVALLWFFVLFVGASPSIVRSASLFSLLAIAQLLRRERIGLNTLGFVALVLLLYNPYWIFDLGFILSFSAVTSILLFQPCIVKYYKPKNPILNYLWQLVVISLVAQIGTLPWTIYYFHAIPLYFLIANILVVPLITILLYVLVVFVFVLWIPGLSVLMSKIVILLAGLLNNIVLVISDLPMATIKNIYLYKSELILLFILLGTLYYLMTQRGYKGLRAVLIAVLLFQVVYGVELLRHRPEYDLKFIVSGRSSYFECAFPNGSLYLLLNDSITDIHETVKWNFNRWSHNQLQFSGILDEGASVEDMSWKNGILVFQDIRLLVASRHQMALREKSDTILTFDYLIADIKNTERVESLVKNYKFKTLIALDYLRNTHKKTYIQICKENNLNFMHLNKKAYIDFL